MRYEHLNMYFSCSSVGLHVVAPRTKEEQSLIDDFILKMNFFSSYWMRIRRENSRLGEFQGFIISFQLNVRIRMIENSYF